MKSFVLLAGASTLGLCLAGTASAQTLPAASNTAAADEAAQADLTTDSEIVVVGTAQGEKKAIETKRQADNVVEALYANDVGKLPDQNVAEAVRRLPGLSVANDQGEGRYVIIRGVNPNLVNVVLNGLTLPAPEPDGRQVKLDDIPSALINSVIVTKSLTVDQDANAIGGEVNIRTLTAFDRKAPLFADARIQYGSYHLNGGHPYEGDAQVGGRFGQNEQFGAVLSVNYSRRPIESQNFQGSTNWRVPSARNGNTVTNANQSYVLPDQAGLRDYNLVRTRKGVVLNLDWHPSDVAKLFLRGTLSRFDDNETRDQFIIDNQTVFSNQTATTGTFTGRGSVRVRRRQEVDNTKSVQGGGNFRLGGAALDIAGGWTRAQKRDPLRSEYNFRTGGTALTVDYDISDTPFLFTPRVRPNANQTAYALNSVNYDTRNAIETLRQGRVDLTLPVAVGNDSSVKLGVKYLDRHKTNARDFLTYGLTSGRTFTLASVSYPGATDFYNGRYIFPVRVSYDRKQAFIAANPGVITANVASSRANSLANDYAVREQIWAGYAMATAHLGPITLVPGVRVEHTRDRTKAKLVTATAALDSDYNSFGTRNYTNWFPGLNAKWEIAGGLIARAAVTTAIGRPNYPDLAPYVQVDLTTSPTTVTLGNPALKPYKATNYDAALEYYLPGQGLISVGYFRKDIDDPIYTGTTVNVAGTFAGQALTGINRVQPLNVDSAKLEGFEANLQVRFTFLPGALDGFGIAANYARITGHGEGTIPGGRSGRFPLFLQSRDVGTAQIFYEKYGLAARAAYSYRSRYLDTIGATAATDQYTDRNGQLDLNLSYEVTPQLTFFGQALNLTDAPWRRYIGVPNQLVERERYGYSFRWGAQLHY
ncbi:TonB-dependent receptor [Sphingomonas metalli]|uniref:TonB-dependent receptor n=1 Tax=Sphingomonas metalli TaxID=1779358 RepID=A0A916WY90_9SPHN|nr:TonB-dependent receptor [Sphingomonas metalli]GGB41817.1 TonB-dependent receptor [Sphingomonas metalli]